VTHIETTVQNIRIKPPAFSLLKKSLNNLLRTGFKMKVVYRDRSLVIEIVSASNACKNIYEDIYLQ
jgi:hypothetical protein